MQFDRLDALRKEKGMTATFLCAQVGRNRFYLKDCRTKNLKVDENTVKVWADLLDTTPAYLLGETDIKEKPAAISGDGAKSELDQLVSNLSAKYGADQIAALLSVADRMDASALTDLLRIVNLGPEAVSGLAAIARRILDAPQQ